MLIDNLHRINSPSDLFKYICEIEEGREKDNELLTQTAKKLILTRKALKLFLAKDCWCDINQGLPITGRDLEVYITATSDENDIVGVFETAYYYSDEGFRLCKNFEDWKVRYWRYLGEEDSAG